MVISCEHATMTGCKVTFFSFAQKYWRVVEKLTTRLFILTHISLVVFFNEQNVLCNENKKVCEKARKNIAENKEKNLLLPIHPTVSAKCPVPLQCAKGGKPFLKEHFHSYPCLQQQKRGDSILCHGGLCSRMLVHILYLCITCVYLGFHEVLEEAKGQIKQ